MKPKQTREQHPTQAMQTGQTMKQKPTQEQTAQTMRQRPNEADEAETDWALPS